MPEHPHLTSPRTLPLYAPPLIDAFGQDYAKIICAMLDIPVHGSVTQSLHVLFTLYSEFKNNPHFGNIGGASGAGGGSGDTGAGAASGFVGGFDDGESKS